MDEYYYIIHLVVFGLFGSLLIWWSRKRIARAETKRTSRVKRLKRFESAKTTTPVETPNAEARETAVESIENRFSIIRKLSFFTIIIVWFVVLIFPFLEKMPATVASILVAASGIIIGIAARPFIENLISGIVISFSHPIRVGDTVIVDNNYGNIEDITITHTVVKIWNWRRYIIPNSRMLSKEIINCTINDSYQWTHVEFWVSYDSDLNKVRELAVDAASHSKYFADYEDPRFWVMDMAEKGYKCWIAAWADTPIDAWELANDIRTSLISAFKSNGIKTHKFELGNFPANKL
jgi:small-conductance mechanosensitive channel